MWNGTKWVHNLTKPLPTITMSADTGAQVDTIGPQHLAKLGLDEEGLLRSSVGLFCADDTKAHYLGVFLAKITGISEATRQSKTVHTMVYVIKGANCLMSRSTLQGLGCLPKSFPEVGKYDEGIAQVNYVAADPKGNTLCRNPESLPTPLSELSGFQPEGRDLPIPTQLATLRVPERGKEGVQSQPIPTQSPHSGYPLGEGVRVRQSSPSPEEENPEVLRAPEEGRDEDDSDPGEPSS